jgi:hypothetical protein
MAESCKESLVDRPAVEKKEEENPQEARAGDFPLPWKTQRARFPHFHRYDYCYPGNGTKQNQNRVAQWLTVEQRKKVRR